MIDVEISAETADRLSSILAGMENAEEKVLKPALTRALMAGKTESVKRIAETYHIERAEIRAKGFLRVNRASESSNGIIGSFEFAGRSIPLMKFNVNPPVPQHGETPSAAVLKESNPVPFSRKKDTFVAKMKTGHIGIFTRRENVYSGKRYTTKKGMVGRNKHNQAIKELLSPSVPQMASREDIVLSVEDRVKEVLDKRIQHELDRLLSSGG